MSMPTEAVEALHEATAALKVEHERRAAWLKANKGDGLVSDATGAIMLPDSLLVSRAEAEAIFDQRILAREARITDLGWKRVIIAKGETVAAVEKAREESIAKEEPQK
jgi:hypothetical protein